MVKPGSSAEAQFQWCSPVLVKVLPLSEFLHSHFNEEKMVTLKHMVLRLVVSDFEDRKEAIKGTPECVPAHLCKR